MRFLMTTALLGSLALSACGEGDTAADPVDDTVAANEMTTDDMTSDGAATDMVIDANTATDAQLSAVDGISPELAAAIVAGQPYADATAFNNVLLETLSEEQAADVRERLFVPVNLNDASEEAIRLIPGMTDKMVHEFEEYRPYSDLAQFDREIGKYVDDAEVARLRRYVTL